MIDLTGKNTSLQENLAKTDVQSVVLSACVFFGTIVQMPTVAEYQYAKAGLLLLAGLIIVISIRSNELSRYRLVNCFLALYCLLTLAATFGRSGFPSAVLYTASIAELFLLFQMQCLRRKMDVSLAVFQVCGICLLVVVDVAAVAFGRSSDSYGYLVGTKFDVVYLHFLIVAITLHRLNTRLRWDVLAQFGCLALLVATLVISWLVDCATGIIGCGLLILIWALFRKMKPRKETLAKLSIPLCLLSAFLLIGYSGIVNTDFVRSLIIEVLHRDPSLTGRMDIYPALVDLVSSSSLLGYGYGSVYTVLMTSVGYANTQNGLFEIMIQGGVASTAMFLVVMYRSFKDGDGSHASAAFAALAFVLIILSCVEVTYRILFFAVLSLVLSSKSFASSTERGNRNV